MNTKRVSLLLKRGPGIVLRCFASLLLCVVTFKTATWLSRYDLEHNYLRAVAFPVLTYLVPEMRRELAHREPDFEPGSCWAFLGEERKGIEACTVAGMMQDLTSSLGDQGFRKALTITQEERTKTARFTVQGLSPTSAAGFCRYVRTDYGFWKCDPVCPPVDGSRTL